MEAISMLKLVEAIGFPALIFIIWFIYHKSTVKNYTEMNHTLTNLVTENSAANKQQVADTLKTNKEAIASVVSAYNEQIQGYTKQLERIAASHEKQVTSILEENAKREERLFKILKDMQENEHYQSVQMEKIETFIKTNQFCPATRKKQEI